MEQPSSRNSPSYQLKRTLRPRVARRNHSLVHLEDEEATTMPVRIAATFPLKKRPGLSLFCAYLLALVILSAPNVLGQTAAHSPGWVVLPVEEYRTLHAKAYPIERDPEPPPVEATLTRVDYDLRIDGELASGRASLTVDVLKDGWVRVPVPAGLLVREARLDGKLVSLVPGASGKAGGQLSALLSYSGRAVLMLDIVIPVVAATSDESITLPSTASGVTRASVQLPRQGVDVRLTGGLLSEKSETASESKWIAYGRGNEALTFAWRRKTEDHRATQPLRMRGSLTQLLGLGEDSTSINAEVNLEVTQGAARVAKIQIPDKVTINQVLGAMVADWEVKANELSVTFLEPVEQNARFVVTGETHSPREGQIDIPLLRLLNTERETGGVAVEVLGAGEIKDLKSEGLDSSDATDLGEGKTLVQARYAVRNNQRNFLKITLPPGATLWSASLAGKAVRPGQSPDGSLLLPLDKARAGEEAPEFAVEIVYLSRGTAWNDKGQFKLALPALDLPVSRTGLLVYHPPLFKVTPEPGAFRMEPYSNPISSALNPPVTYSVTGAGIGPGVGGAVPAFSAAPAPPSADMDAKDETKLKRSQAATEALLDKFRTDSLAGKRAGILPIRVSFPAFGPSLYLVSELTGENQAPSAGLTYQHEKKAGGK